METQIQEQKRKDTVMADLIIFFTAILFTNVVNMSTGYLKFSKSELCLYLYRQYIMYQKYWLRL